MTSVNNNFSIDVRSFLAVTLLFSLIAGIGLYSMYSTDAASMAHARRLADQMHNGLTAKAIGMDLRNLFVDLQLVSHHVEVLAYMSDEDEEARRNVEREFINLCRISKVYDQVRILDNDGQELVRVNYNNGKPAAVPPGKLQNKGNRYYFIESTKLPRKGIYVSPFDLNIENGRIEQPLKPMVRVSTPLYDNEGKRLGYAILNYLGQHVLNTISNNVESEHMHSMLLNMDGYWLLSDGEHRAWNFMYEDRKEESFARLYPEAWQTIQSQENGQFYTKQGSYTFSTITVSPEFNIQLGVNTQQWKLVCFTSSAQIQAAVTPLNNSYLGISTGILFIILFSAFARSRYVRGRERARVKLEQARLAAEDANMAKSDFLARMSHEIRTPMNAVIGMTHLALKTELTAKQLDYLQKISISAQSLLAIINDILDFSKVEAGRLSIENVDFLLDDVLNTTVNMLGLQAEQKGLEFLLLVRSNVPNLLIGDPLRLGQVLTNLTSNAIKFTETGEVILTAELVEEKEDEALICFSVKDTGIGISEEQAANLFQPFSQADGSITRKFGGTGLGLAICKRIVEILGGEIKLESTPGEGSEFWFTLPFKLQARHSGTHHIYPEEIRNMRVLVVDDSRMSRLVLSKILESFTFEVETASGGEAALNMIHENDDETPFNLVITDWRMPDLTGLELTQRIKGSKTLENMPKIIMLTSFGRDEVRHQAKQTELDGFMLKPFNRSLLFDTIMDVFGWNGSSSKQIDNTQKHNGVPANVAGAHVLLAEDNEINQQVAREILECADITVTIANNGREALEILEHETFDGVLMDIQMPEMDGFQTVKAIRADDRFKDLPVIAMTAHALVGDREKSLLSGMNDHVTKPIDPDLLMEVLGNWLPTNSKKPASKPTSRTQDEIEVPFPDLPGINIRKGLHRVCGNRPLYEKLLTSFALDCNETLLHVETMTANDAIEKIRPSIHKLKGVAGNVGAERLHGMLEQISASWENGGGPKQQLLMDFQAECVQVAEAILQLFPPLKQDLEVESDLCPTKARDLLPQLESLAELLVHHDVEARMQFNEIKPELNEMAPGFTAELSNMLDAFDFVGCHERVRELLRQCGKTGDADG